MKRHNLLKNAIGCARTLRRNATEAEKILYYALREKLPQMKFRRQVPIGSYIVDFVSHRMKIIIELDGSQHAAQQAYDEKRSMFLRSEGYRVIRFWNNEVNDNLDGILLKISQLK